MINLNFTIIFVILIYTSVLIAIVAYSYSQVRNANTLFMKANMNKTVLGLSIGASDMSAWLLMGLPGSFYSSGFIASIWIIIGLCIGQYANITLLGQRVRAFNSVLKSVTIPEYLSSRLCDKTGIIRLISSLLIIVFSTIYISSSITALGKLLDIGLGIDQSTAKIASAFIILLQSSIGGFMAVSLTDAFQTLFISSSLLIILIASYFILSNHEVGILSGEYYNVITDTSFSGTAISYIAIISGLSWGLGYLGQPHLLVRFKSLASDSDAYGLRRACLIWMYSSFILIAFLAVIGIIADSMQLIEVDDPERIIMHLSIFSLGNIGGALFITAVISASISTANSQLLVAGSILMKDILISILEIKRELVRILIARLSILIALITALYLSLNGNSTVLSLVSYAWGGLGATIGPLMLMTSLSNSINWQGGIACLISGAISVFVFMKYNSYFLGLYELLPSFIIASLACIIVSKLTGGPNQEVKNKFGDIINKYN